MGQERVSRDDARGGEKRGQKLFTETVRDERTSAVREKGVQMHVLHRLQILLNAFSQCSNDSETLKSISKELLKRALKISARRSQSGGRDERGVDICYCGTKWNGGD